jgi:hypothetical protein
MDFTPATSLPGPLDRFRSREDPSLGSALVLVVRTAKDQPTVVQHGDLVRKALDLVQVLRGEGDGAAALLHVHSEIPEPSALTGVEGGGRLVQQENVGLANECDRHVQPLLVPGRELCRRPVGLRKVDEREQARGGCVGVPSSLEACEEREILAGAQTAVLRGTLRHPPDPRGRLPPDDDAVTRIERPGEDGEKGRFPGAVRADERERASGSNLDRRRLERGSRAEAAGDSTRREYDAVVRHEPDATTVRPYDHETEIPANQGVRHLPRGGAWDWDFEVDGALALDRARHRLNAGATSDSLPRMAWPEAPGLAARAALREEERAKVRRARRTAATVVAAVVALLVLLLALLGSSDAPLVGTAGPAPAQRLLPSEPPRPLVVAVRDSLRLQLPIHQSRVTAIGYHASGVSALALEPVGSQANAGVFGRIVQRLLGGDGSGIRYYQLEGGAGPQTGGLDIGAPVGTDVFAPVDGTVIAISDRIINGRKYGQRIEIQPSGNPSMVVALANVQIDPVLTVGQPVVSARTKLGRVLDLSSAEQAGLARYTQDEGQHVHLEVHAAASIAP